MKILFTGLALGTVLTLIGTNAVADVESVFSDPTQNWINFTSGTGEDTPDNALSGAQVYPGYGGQKFDAEYLFYKRVGKYLYIGLQTGFNIKTGQQDIDGNPLNHTTCNNGYYAGDLALAFNNTSNTITYNYAIDFGFLTKNYNQIKVDADTSNSDGKDEKGIYSGVSWNNDMVPAYKTESMPFAMTDGNRLGGFGEDSSGKDDASYYHFVSFNLDLIPNLDWKKGFTLDAHWTMSCGNDAVNGHTRVAPVPEPATMLLFGTGLMGLAGIARRRRNI